MKLSVIITCYNYGKYLEQCLNSVLNSTFKDLEIIIVNDGSNDKLTIKVLKDIESKKYNNVKIIKQKNSGVSIAKNNGLKLAKGEYVYCLDADDSVKSDYFSKAVYFLDNNKSISFVYSGNTFFNDLNNKEVNIKSFDYNLYVLMKFNYIIGNNYIIRKDDILSVGGYKDCGFEDWELLINLGEHRYFGQYLPFHFHNYRFHRDLSSRYVKDKKKKGENILNIRKLHEDLYKRKSLEEIKKRYFDNCFQFVFYIFRFYFYSLFTKRIKMASIMRNK